MNSRSILTNGAVALTLLLLSATANATWSSYEYRNSNGDYRYGIRDGNNHVPLNETSRKKARKAAKKMNKNDKSVMAGPNGEGDLRSGGGELSR